MDRHLAPFRAALSCVAHGRLVTTDERTYVVDRVYALVINGGDPLELRRKPTIALKGGQLFRIVRDDARTDGPHRVQTVEYFYVFTTDDDQELLNFQWTPEAPTPETGAERSGQKTFPPAGCHSSA